MAVDSSSEETTTPPAANLGFPAPPGPDIAANADRIGNYVWLAARLFEITGGWATTTRESEIRVGIDGVASRFAWQAGEWRDRLPRLAEVDRERLIGPPSPSAVTALENFAATAPPDRPAALLDVLDRIEAVLVAHAAAASPLRDAPLLRSVHRIRAEMEAQRREIRGFGGVMGHSVDSISNP